MELASSGTLPALPCPADPRFGYFSFVPDSVPPAATVVVVHGTDRRVESMRDVFVAWARTRQVAVVAPLFPAGLGAPSDVDDYKYVHSPPGPDHGAVLEAIVDDVASRFGAPRSFALVGFSGGAQFANRYALLRPHRLWSLVLAAPGNVTRIDPDRTWWVGTAGRRIDLAAVAAVPVLTVVGGADDGPAVPVAPSSPYWVDGANDSGRTRIERVAALAANLRAHGVRVREVTLPGVGHEFAPMAASVQEFLDAERGTR